MKTISQQPNKIKKEFVQLLDYHIRKLEQLVKIDQAHAHELKYMQRALQGSRGFFRTEDITLAAIKDCMETIKAGQGDGNKLPIQEEILQEMGLFKLRFGLV